MLGCQQYRAVNRRLNEAVATGRAKSSETWKVGNVSEQAKARRCTAVEDLVLSTRTATLGLQGKRGEGVEGPSPTPDP